jgi:hypothetical protein
MPLYHFNLMAGVTRVLDPRGTYLSDDDAARRYAEQLVRGQLVQGLKWSIEVITENGDFVDMVEPLEGHHALKSQGLAAWARLASAAARAAAALGGSVP